jgi:hypothetical protein
MEGEVLVSGDVVFDAPGRSAAGRRFSAAAIGDGGSASSAVKLGSRKSAVSPWGALLALVGIRGSGAFVFFAE